MSAPIRKVRWVSLKPKGVLAVTDPNRKTNGGMFRYLVGNFLANQPGGGSPAHTLTKYTERTLIVFLDGIAQMAAT